MSSLVGYGVSSDSDSEEEEGGGSSAAVAEGRNKGKAEGEKTRNFLLESGSASSESSSESEQEQEEATEPPRPATPPSSSSESLPCLPPRTAAHKLPPPPLGEPGSVGLAAGSSVFANPFRERAEKRLNVLQKHVPLTLQARPAQIGGKKICLAYRKDGRCRFGSRCKFAHDSDLQSPAGLQTEPDAPESGPEAQAQTKPNSTGPHGTELRNSALRRDSENEDESHKRKKHRVGISDTLIPPKRALKQYAMQKDRLSHS